MWPARSYCQSWNEANTHPHCQRNIREKKTITVLNLFFWASVEIFTITKDLIFLQECYWNSKHFLSVREQCCPAASKPQIGILPYHQFSMSKWVSEWVSEWANATYSNKFSHWGPIRGWVCWISERVSELLLPTLQLHTSWMNFSPKLIPELTYC